MSPRRDARANRARLLILLLELRCPPAKRPKRSWYVPGGVARTSLEDLAARWPKRFHLPPPCRRTLLRHICRLSAGGAIVRVPGDLLGWGPDPDDPQKAPRFPDTLLVLTTELEWQWWATVGLARLDANPGARKSASIWRRLFGRWRGESAGRQGELFHVDPQAPTVTPDSATLRRLANSDGLLDLLGGLKAAGVALASRMTWRLASSESRLRGAIALLARAIGRGDRIQNFAGWLVHAFSRAPRAELEQAARWAGGGL